jgi:hypothetical protein
MAKEMREACQDIEKKINVLKKNTSKPDKVSSPEEEDTIILESLQQYYLFRKNYLIFEFFNIADAIKLGKRKVVEHPVLFTILNKESMYNAHTGFLIVNGFDAEDFIQTIKDRYGHLLHKFPDASESFYNIIRFCEQAKSILEFVDLDYVPLEDYLKACEEDASLYDIEESDV